jgi:UDP-N-acetylglucosamine 2-epimerase (non-hydrolysing)
MQTARKSKIITVVGARPNFMKAAPILAAIRDHNDRLISSPDATADALARIEFESLLVHTGQHYDWRMSGTFFADLNMRPPDVHLGAGPGTHAAQTADIMKKFEAVMLGERPDVLIVVGDVNSTVACSLVASKISYDEDGNRPCIVHVEAGLRSFDRGMPEEINRIVTDHLADLLFVTEKSGVQNLIHEGIPESKIHFVGNTMIDCLRTFEQRADQSSILDGLALRNPFTAEGRWDGIAQYALVTLHRPSNVDREEGLRAILQGIEELADNFIVVFPAHPRTQKKILEFGMEALFTRSDIAGGAGAKIRMIDPLGYLDFLCLMKNAAVVITDSGGIQEETTALGVPCVTVRENTERPVTVEQGTNVLAGVTVNGIRRAVRTQLQRVGRRTMPEGWDGRSAERIVRIICTQLSAANAGIRLVESIEPVR